MRLTRQREFAMASGGHFYNPAENVDPTAIQMTPSEARAARAEQEKEIRLRAARSASKREGIRMAGTDRQYQPRDFRPQRSTQPVIVVAPTRKPAVDRSGAVNAAIVAANSKKKIDSAGTRGAMVGSLVGGGIAGYAGYKGAQALANKVQTKIAAKSPEVISRWANSKNTSRLSKYIANNPNKFTKVVAAGSAIAGAVGGGLLGRNIARKSAAKNQAVQYLASRTYSEAPATFGKKLEKFTGNMFKGAGEAVKDVAAKVTKESFSSLPTEAKVAAVAVPSVIAAGLGTHYLIRRNKRRKEEEAAAKLGNK